jgi:4'-phosphopantetheinyl transferase
MGARRIVHPVGELWLLDMDRAAAALRLLGGAERWLTRSDHLRLKRIRDHAEKARRAATYVALRLVIGTLAGRRHTRARMLRLPGRAPRLLGVPAVFNLSHSEHLALIGVARRGRIGVDMEAVRTVPMSPRNRGRIVSAANELSRGRVLAPEADGDVLQAWTRLESFSKATGRGINRTLADFGIRAQQNPRWHTQGGSIPDKARRQLPGYTVLDVALPGAIAAVARTLSCR